MLIWQTLLDFKALMCSRDTSYHWYALLFMFCLLINFRKLESHMVIVIVCRLFRPEMKWQFYQTCLVQHVTCLSCKVLANCCVWVTAIRWAPILVDSITGEQMDSLHTHGTLTSCRVRLRSFFDWDIFVGNVVFLLMMAFQLLLFIKML